MEVRERPILFRGEMVRAILDGRKSQTRRVVKPQPVDVLDNKDGSFDFHDGVPGNTWDETFCPYGNPGDRLWVRETWSAWHETSIEDNEWELLKGRFERSDCNAIEYAATSDSKPEQWRPSIFMPRWASRITLEITDVRVERLQGISEADAKAEGAPNTVPVPIAHPLKANRTIGMAESEATHREGFQFLWQSIHVKEHTWESNPWLWVISFKRVEAGK